MIGCHHAASVGAVIAPPKPRVVAIQSPIAAPVVAAPVPPGERTILPQEAAPATVNYCIAEPGYVKHPTGFWTPSEAEAREADEELARGLVERGNDIARYHRQYTGVVDGKRKLVYVSAASVDSLSFLERNERGGVAFDWHRDPWEVCDGGAGFFQAAYDPAKKRFVVFSYGGLYEDPANAMFDDACSRSKDGCAPMTAERAPKWRRVASELEKSAYAEDQILPRSRYERAMDALYAAFASRQLGDTESAMRVYRRFLAEYGSDEALRDEGAQWAKTIFMVYDELATTYFSVFEYERAAELYGQMEKRTVFDAESRAVAATNHASLMKAIRNRSAPRLLVPAGPMPLPP